jgi:hydroxyacylglutathione hydrolase
MARDITTIGLGGVNCYALAAGDDFVLVDTGLATSRGRLQERLRRLGCKPADGGVAGRLKLVLLTHGDVDHAGNAAYLQRAYHTPVAIHAADAAMVQAGDMAAGRKPRPDQLTLTGHFIRVAGWTAQRLRRGDAVETFTPDLLVDDGLDLAPYGLEARVIHLPGHSAGSLGVLTAAGDLICGDLIYDWTKPSVPIKDDEAAHRASMAKLRGLRITTVYPGHGKPFAWNEELIDRL